MKSISSITSIEAQNRLNKNNTYGSSIATGVVLLLWTLFAASLAFMAAQSFNVQPQWLGSYIRLSGFSFLLWTTVTFFGAMVATYAKRYLQGFKRRDQFMLLALGFTFSVMLLTVADNVLLLLLAWWLMGLQMSKLIGIYSDWGEAKEASKFTLRYFLSGTALFGLALSILVIAGGSFSLSILMENLKEMPKWIHILASLCVIMAAIVQSALYPFQRWLMSAMTAPTPASALMHAGFVNGGGILLALFAPLLVHGNVLTLLFIIGGTTALLAQFSKLLQVNIKHKLAASTIAQMGFMIMQCGMGFFNAAVAHLILHGFYKAYLFLSSGEEISRSTPGSNANIKTSPLQFTIVLLSGITGALLFMMWTGKSAAFDSSLFLTLIVAITVGQATYNIAKEFSLSAVQKVVLTPIIFVAGIGSYALVYNGVSHMMSDMPMSLHLMPLSGVQITFGLLFLLGFFIMKLGLYKKIPWLYVKLLNMSQPFNKTVLTYKTKTL